MTGTDEAVVRRGRPRDERIDEQITEAALDVLAREGFGRFSVEAVAAEAGVAKTTVYRRFPCREDLIAGAIDRLNEAVPVAPSEGSVREQLVELLSAIRSSTPFSQRGRILMRAAGQGSQDPETARLVHERVLARRRQSIRDCLTAGIASGELRSDIDMDAVIPVLVGPMLYLGMWNMCDIAARVSVEDVVDMVMQGLTRASD